ncbi:hypothetical protein V2J09_005865 [Rumex salicifolius]
MPKHRIRNKIKHSALYSFCVKPNASQSKGPAPTTDDGPGYSRIVYCNQSHLDTNKAFKYAANNISTTKYNIVTFLPKALFEQFRRAANIYFLVASLLSLTPISPFSALSMIAPLAMVVGLTMAKEAVEDWKRFVQDMRVNSRKVDVHDVVSGDFVPKVWQEVQVGDVVKVMKDEFFPADLLMLSSGYEDGICYVETMNLDGETNLKVRRSLEVTMALDEDSDFKDFSGTIKCESPNSSLYTFIGNLEYDDQVYPLDPSQILLRDSKLRNTTHVYGVAIFTGHESKVMQNATDSPSKRSGIERKMDRIICLLFSVLVLISLLSSIGYAIKAQYEVPYEWYLQPNEATSLDDPTKPTTSGLVHLITALILYGYLIPISLYVSIEFVKFLQAIFIDQDIEMYHTESGTCAQARTSNLNEELGQVDTILSDKTGTLTCNQMDFLKCSIGGIAYGTKSSEVELAATKHIAMEETSSEAELESVITSNYERETKSDIKGFGFEDSRLMNGGFLNEPNLETIVLFCRILAVCQSAIPEMNEKTSCCTYEVESPDENAFLVAAREFGFEFYKRTQSSVFIRERYPNYEKPVEREYKILNLLEFTSKRKRMSVIVRDEEGKIFLFCKGADSIIFDRLSKNGKAYVEATTDQLNEYGDAGLRTLALSYKKLNEDEYTSWNNEFQKARTSIGMIDLEKDPYSAFALIIDGKNLAYALEDDMKLHFLSLAVQCASVICCRVSPKQKALVTRLVREGTGKTTLAIGDAFGLTLFYFEAFAGFSGQTIYDDWYSLSFNVILTSLPVLALGVFEQDFPSLYQQGPKNLFFDWYKILTWIANGVYCSIVVFFLTIAILSKQAFRKGGQTSDMSSVGTTMFTCIIWAVNCQISLTMSHFTWIQHLLIWGSIFMWYIFLVVYGMFGFSGYVYCLFLEVLAPAPIFWSTTFVVTAACNLPYLAHIAKDVEDQNMWTKERSKARTKTQIGFTARVEAKIRHLKNKIHRKSSSFHSM